MPSVWMAANACCNVQKAFAFRVHHLLFELTHGYNLFFVFFSNKDIQI